MSISTEVTPPVARQPGRAWTLASRTGLATRRDVVRSDIDIVIDMDYDLDIDIEADSDIGLDADADVARPTSIHPTLVTVTANVDQDGGFVLAYGQGDATVGGGVELAETLSAYPLYGADLRLVLAWPRRPSAQPSLLRNIRQLAEATGAVVWTPSQGGRAEFVAQCRDLAAVDVGGEIAAWEPHYPGRPEQPRFFSDADGRLVPACGPVVMSRPSVSLVSVSAVRSRLMARRYAAFPTAETGSSSI